jgi:hypothetical protein
MKTCHCTPWWPLVRNELRFDHFPIVPWLLGWAYCLAIWFGLGWLPWQMMTKNCGGDIALFFSSSGEVLFVLASFWLFIALMLAGTTTVPGVVRSETYEFYFTRAIARRSLFRAKTMVLFAVVLGPLILNMFLAFSTPDLVVKPGMMGFQSEMNFAGADPARLARYEQAFPGGHRKVVRPDVVDTAVEIAFPRAAPVFAGWLLWGGTLGLLAIQAYCAGMARHVSRRFSSVMTFTALPFLPVGFVLADYSDYLSNVLENCFLFFAQNELVLVLAVVAAIPFVERWAERRFTELEII